MTEKGYWRIVGPCGVGAAVAPISVWGNLRLRCAERILPTPDPAPTFAPQRPFLAHKSVNTCDVGQAWKTHEQEHTSYFALLKGTGGNSQGLRLELAPK